MYEDKRRSVCAPVCVRLPCTKKDGKHNPIWQMTLASPAVEPNVSNLDTTIATMSVWTTPPLCLLAYLALLWGPVVRAYTRISLLPNCPYMHRDGAISHHGRWHECCLNSAICTVMG